jgi:glutathione S-transferase
MGPIVQELVHKPAEARDQAKADAAVAAFKDALSQWSARLEAREFLVGDSLTLADIVLFTPIYSVENIVGQSMVRDASIREWYERIKARPSTAYP